MTYIHLRRTMCDTGNWRPWGLDNIICAQAPVCFAFLAGGGPGRLLGRACKFSWRAISGSSAKGGWMIPCSCSTVTHAAYSMTYLAFAACPPPACNLLADYLHKAPPDSPSTYAADASNLQPSMACSTIWILSGTFRHRARDARWRRGAAAARAGDDMVDRTGRTTTLTCGARTVILPHATVLPVRRRGCDCLRTPSVTRRNIHFFSSYRPSPRAACLQPLLSDMPTVVPAFLATTTWRAFSSMVTQCACLAWQLYSPLALPCASTAWRRGFSVTPCLGCPTPPTSRLHSLLSGSLREPQTLRQSVGRTVGLMRPAAQAGIWADMGGQAGTLYIVST